MGGITALACAALAISAVCILISCFKSGHVVRSVVMSVLSGVGALCAVNLLGMVSNVTIAFTPLSVGISCAGGVPGVIFLLVFDVLCKI